MPVYNSQMMLSDLYNSATSAEVLAGPGKPKAYDCTSPAETGQQNPATENTLYPGQSFVSGECQSQINWLSKGGNWEISNSQVPLDNFNSMKLVRSDRTQEIPVHMSSEASQNILAATLIRGALQSGRPDSFGKDGSIAQCSLMATNVSTEAMQGYLMSNGSDGNVGVTNMVPPSPPNPASLNCIPRWRKVQQNPLEVAFPSNQSSITKIDRSQGDGSILCPQVPSPRADHVPNNMRIGEELLFLPLTISTWSKKHLNEQVTTANTPDQEFYAKAKSKMGQRFPSNFSTQQHQQSLQAGSESKLYRESLLAGDAHGQGLNLSLSSKRPLSLRKDRFHVRILSEDDNSITSPMDVKTFGHIPIEIASSLSSFHSRRNGDYHTEIHDIANLGESPQFHLNQRSHVGHTSLAFLSRSKYLEATQQLLDEVCNVTKEIIKHNSPGYQNEQLWKGQKQEKMKFRSTHVVVQGSLSKDHAKNAEAMHLEQEPPVKYSADLAKSLSALNLEDRGDCETRKGKLLAMLQEVDRCYRIYKEQMNIIVASFDSILGNGGAIPYTTLAMHAMSCYFRSLRDAISGQIQLVCKALDEEEVGRQLTKRGGIARLHDVYQHLFQQIALVQRTAWRTQRGLPENSVSVLRAWLFEHFLHPYPKDLDKVMLARQTGLTKRQVSNWFINARVRLWKPMVERIYQEEASDTSEKQNVEGENSQGHGTSEPRRVYKTWKSKNSNDPNDENLHVDESTNAPERAAELQVFLEEDGLSSDLYPQKMSSTGNENMKHGAGYDAHLFTQSNSDAPNAIQMKRSRIGIPGNNNLHLTPANKEAVIESKENHTYTFCDADMETHQQPDKIHKSIRINIRELDSGTTIPSP